MHGLFTVRDVFREPGSASRASAVESGECRFQYLHFVGFLQESNLRKIPERMIPGKLVITTREQNPQGGMVPA